MAVSVSDIIVKRQHNKWNNYPKLKEAIECAYTSINNWYEVELNTPWLWECNIMTASLTVHYSRRREPHGKRYLIVSLI